MKSFNKIKNREPRPFTFWLKGFFILSFAIIICKLSFDFFGIISEDPSIIDRKVELIGLLAQALMLFFKWYLKIFIVCGVLWLILGLFAIFI